MLNSQGQGALVQTVLASIAPDWQNWTKDPVALENARIQLGEELDLLGGGSGGGSPTLQAPASPWPANGSVSAGTTLTLQWGPVSGASQYQVYSGLSSGTLSLSTTVNAPTINAALYNLQPGTTYHWQVVALAGSSSATSAVWSFTTPGTAPGAPPAPTLLAPTGPYPVNGGISEGTTLTAQWGSVSGATQYRVYLGSSASSLSLSTTVSAPTVNAAFYNLAAGTTYYWQVVAVAGSNTASSAIWSFTTPGAPPSQTLSAPTVVWPLNGSTGSATTLTVQWGPVTGATQYQVYSGYSSTNLTLYTTVSAPAVNAAFYNLNANATYYWKIVAISGNSSTSGAVWSFTTN